MGDNHECNRWAPDKHCPIGKFIYLFWTAIVNVIFVAYAQVSYRILGRGYLSTGLFAENKYTEIESRGSHLK